MDNSEKQIFIETLKYPFKYKGVSRNNLSIAASNRWQSASNLLKMAYNMIDTADDLNISYEILKPEDWDNLFYRLGGGRKFRKIEIFLKIMSWEQFLENITTYIKSK